MVSATRGVHTFLVTLAIINRRLCYNLYLMHVKRTDTMYATSFEFKLCTLVRKCLSRPTSHCTVVLRRHCMPVSSATERRHRRSAARCDLIVPRTGLARYGPQSFVISGPALWNSLPLTARDSSLTSAMFSRRLTTELYIGGHMTIIYSTRVIIEGE